MHTPTVAFTPALGQTTHLVLPEFLGNTLRLRFTALLSNVEYDSVVRDSGQVQLWSDFPVPGRADGEWGELIFQKQGGAQHSDGVLLSLECRVAAVPARFSFTYRIMFASGDIAWLGGYGDNGVLVIDPFGSSTSRDILGRGWSKAGYQQDMAYTRNVSGKSASEEEIFRVDRDEYRVWAVSKDGSVTLPRDVPLLFLVPRTDAGDLVLPYTLTLGAPSGCSFSVTDRGAVTVSGEGTVKLIVHESGLGDLDAMLSHCNVDLRHVCCSLPPHVMLASQKNVSPVTVLALPLCPSPDSPGRISVTIHDVAVLVPDTHQVCVYSGHESTVQFISSYGLGCTSFVIDRTGDIFTVAPLYALTSSDTTKQCHIAILTPYSPLSGNLDILPTPPPSPRLRPVAHLLSSQNGDLVGDDASEQSVPTLSNTALSSPIERPSTPREQSPSTESTIPIARFAENRVTEHSTQPSVIAKYLAFFVAIASIFVKSIMCRVFRLVFGDTQRLRTDGEASRTGSNTGRDEDNTTVVSASGRQLVNIQPTAAAHPQQNDTGHLPVGTSVASPLLDSQFESAALSELMVPTTVDTRSLSSSRPAPLTFCAEVPAGVVSVVRRVLGSSKGVPGLLVTFDGHCVSARTSQEVEEGVSLMTFNVEKAGVLNISLAEEYI